MRAYADALLDILDPSRELLSLRLYRDHCCPIEASYTKDLSALDRKLQHLVLGPVGTHVPGAPYCTCGPRASLLRAVRTGGAGRPAPRAPRTVRTPYVPASSVPYLPRAVAPQP